MDTSTEGVPLTRMNAAGTGTWRTRATDPTVSPRDVSTMMESMDAMSRGWFFVVKVTVLLLAVIDPMGWLRADPEMAELTCWGLSL